MALKSTSKESPRNSTSANTAPHRDRVSSRRKILQVGSLGALGITLPRLLQADTIRSHAASADACILIFLNGGPSHHDMWDMKPDAPAEIRGPFQPIATTLPGVQLCEHLPRLAGHMHRASLVRSVHHSVNNAHAAAVYTALTGHDRGDAKVAVAAGPQDYPAIGSVTGMLRPPEAPIVPFVSLPYITEEGRGGPPQPGFFGGWLGNARDPLFVLRDPNAAEFAIPELTRREEVTLARLNERRRLQAALARGFNDEPHAVPAGMSGFQERAFDLLSSPATQKAFQVEQEPDAVREAYGRNIYGQSVLLARRLIEAGTRVVSISWAPDANATWDTHGGNFDKLEKTLLPQLDMAVSSLIGDLVDRGRLDRTLVVVMGEFGRTPKINANAGRDHWNFCYSLMLCGGGIKPGYVHGASDKIGGEPARDAVQPAEVIAAIYQALGIPAETELHDATNRPYILVPWGKPIPELFA